MPRIGASLVLIAVGAVLYFALTVNSYNHGFDINTVGLILMVVGGIGLVLSLVFASFSGGGWSGPRRHRTVIDDGQGHVVQRDDISR